MTREKHIRRAGIICCHCLRNLAFYRASRPNKKTYYSEQFWITAESNFLDIAVLEWLKLFGDKNGKHCWEKVVTDSPAFFSELLTTLALTKNEFTDYIKEMRTYRDKFIAHLDNVETMHIPVLENVKSSAIYLYDYLYLHDEESNIFIDSPANATIFYEKYRKEGQSLFNQIGIQ